MRTLIFAVCILLSTGSAFAQEEDVVTLSLDECIATALDKNIDLKVAENNARISKSDKVLALSSFLPNLQANVNFNMLFGTFWDNVAARQVTQQNSSNPNLNSSIVLFNGFSRINNMKSSDHAYDAAQLDIESSELQTKSNVLSAYLAVILDKENVKMSENRFELLQNQLEREVKRESVGVGNLESVYNFRSQAANEKLTLINLKNQYKRDLLILLQLLRVDVSKSYTVEEYEVREESLLSEASHFDEILSESISNSPFLRSAKSNQLASTYQYKSSKGGLLPTVSVYGEIGSRYSSQGAANPDNNLMPEKAPYLDQMVWNEYEYIGINMSIPLFSRYQNSNNIQTAKLNMLNAELATEQAEQTLANTVQQVYLDLLAAQESYRTGQENLEATSQTFEFMKKRFETGNTDFYTYLESLNNKNRAELELVNAKYSIVFRQKILELYSGSELTKN